MTRKPMRASELMAKLEDDELLHARNRMLEIEWSRARERDAFMERPIIEDLASVGVNVTSVWDLVNDQRPYEPALPILVRHLESRTYPGQIMEGLARAMAVPAAAPWWSVLHGLLSSAKTEREAAGIAVALAASATAEHYDRLVELARRSDLGEERAFFLHPIVRIGRSRGWTVVEDLISDSDIGAEAKRMVLGRAQRQRRRMNKDV